jgi:hypothetical protein
VNPSVSPAPARVAVPALGIRRCAQSVGQRALRLLSSVHSGQSHDLVVAEVTHEVRQPFGHGRMLGGQSFDKTQQLLLIGDIGRRVHGTPPVCGQHGDSRRRQPATLDGTVAGASLDIEGVDSTMVVANTSHVIMRSRQVLNLIGIAKGEMQMDFKADASGPKMHFIFDPTGGCMPPLPLKTDTTLEMPSAISELHNNIFALVQGVKFDSGGLIKCGDFIYRLGEIGVEYLGQGVIIGGQYAALGTDYAVQYGSMGVGYAGQYGNVATSVAGDAATGAYGSAADGVMGAGGTMVSTFSNTWNTIEDFGKSVACAFGLGGCGQSSTPDMAPTSSVASPFVCPQGQLYSMEFGRCLRTSSALYSYSGSYTDGSRCITSGGVTSQPAHLDTCSPEGLLYQGNAGELVYPAPSAQVCLGTTDGTFAPGSRLAFGICDGVAPSFNLDTEGRLAASLGGENLCVRPDTPLSHPIAFGRMADWKSLGGQIKDITVDAAGRVWAIAQAGEVYEIMGPDQWSGLGGSGFVRLDGGIAGSIWGVTATGAVKRFHGGWQDVPGNLWDVGAGGLEGKAVYGISDGYVVLLEADQATWTPVSYSSFSAPIPVAGVRIDVDGFGNPWVVQQDGSVLQRIAGNSNEFVQVAPVPGGAADISAGLTGTIMVTTNRDEIYVLSGDTWAQFPGMATNIAIAPDGSPWVTLDVATESGSVFVHNSSTKATGWTGLPQPDALAFTSGSYDGNTISIPDTSIGDTQLILDRCDPTPMATAWTSISPKVNTDVAAAAGLSGPFRLEHNTDFGGIRPLGYDWVHLTDSTGTVLQPVPSKYRARSEFSAIFAAPDTFALYHHITGMCAEDPGYNDSAGAGAAWLKKCTFVPEQLWTRTDVGNSRYLVQNTGTTRYLNPSKSTLVFQGTGIEAGMVHPASLPAPLQGWFFTPAPEPTLPDPTMLDLFSQLAIGADGSVFGIGYGDNVYGWDGSKWEYWEPAGQVDRDDWEARSVSVDPHGIPWIVQKNNLEVFRWDPAQSTWVSGYGPMLDISIGANGTPCGIAVDTVVRCWNGTSWGHPAGAHGSGEQIAVSADGLPWIVASDNTVWRYDANAPGFISVPGGLLDIAFGADNSVFGIGTDNSIWKWNPTAGGWQPFGTPGFKATAIAVGPAGNPWIAGLSHKPYQWDGTAWALVR